MSKYAVLTRVLPFVKEEDKRCLYVIEFADEYSDWFEFVRNHKDMEGMRIEFCDTEEQYAAVVAKYPEFKVDMSAIDCNSDNDVPVGHIPIIGYMWKCARDIYEHPDYPDATRDADFKALKIDNEFAQTHECPEGVAPVEAFSYLTQLIASGGMSQRCFGLLLQAGITPDEYLRLVEALCVHPREFTTAEGRDEWRKWAAVPEMVDVLCECDAEDRHKVRLAGEKMCLAFSTRVALLASLLTDGMSHDDVVAWADSDPESVSSRVLSRLWRLIYDGYGDNQYIGKRGRKRDANHELQERVGMVLDEGECSNTAYIQAILALPEDEFSFVVDVLAGGHSLEDIEPFVDCLDSFLDAYKQGVSAADLLA